MYDKESNSYIWEDETSECFTKTMNGLSKIVSVCAEKHNLIKITNQLSGFYEFWWQKGPFDEHVQLSICKSAKIFC